MSEVQELTGRVQRERDAYNHGVERTTYQKILSHSCAFSRPAYESAIIEKIRTHGENKRVLELGSLWWVNWVEKPGIDIPDLHAINISEAELNKARKVAEGTRTKPNFHLMDAHALEFESDSFNVVFGASILHHLDLHKSLSEIKRVLRPGGLMVFFEPLAINPVGKFVRWATPFARTEDEQPFRFKEISKLREHFDVDIEAFELFSVPAGVLSGLAFKAPQNVLTRTANWIDETIKSVLPPTKWLFRVCVITGTA